jgi:hypothetical protein
LEDVGVAAEIKNDTSGRKETATGFRAQHSMNGPFPDQLKKTEQPSWDQIDNLEAGIASDSLNAEVKDDSYCCPPHFAG